MDFSAYCQGVGSKYDMLLELSRREKMAGIKPDEDLDLFMKVRVYDSFIYSCRKRRWKSCKIRRVTWQSYLLRPSY
ncbi:abc transporter g family member 32 [Nicotiana attenuata]|uniref:Abc transporter g family member 32 n=1 Tax=Nicotiana attenuata TaxID=49451 RepID=A0A314KRE1_NICAT|nr:abc transporter g family member 32 [Nicotiana attenuata]